MEVALPNGRVATYEVIGSGGEPLLAFVGGPGLAARLMRPDAELFAERFTCYLIDPHGSGGSTPPRDETAYDPVGHARFYDEVRRALDLGPVSVYGVSFGGTVALTYAALFPENTARCIAVSAFAVGEELDEEEGGEAAAEMETALVRHAEAEWYLEAREVWDAWTPRALAATDPEEIKDMLATVFPLYTAYPGYALFNLRGGFRFNENQAITADFENIFDKSHRSPGWGIDGPGRSVTVRYQYRF